MPAIDTDIAAAIRRARVETWSDANVKTRYPNARDGLASPAEGFFDAAADGVTAITFRAALFGIERRRFVGQAQALNWHDLTAGIPIVGLVDAEQALNGNHIPARIEVDPDAEITSYEAFG